MAIYSKLIEGLTNGETYYAKVFTVNPKERINNRVDLPVASAIPSGFPSEPSEYSLIDTYTTETTFTAPETGWYQIELHGASGNGGNGYAGMSGYYDDDGDYIVEYYTTASGGSGGGGAYVCSRVKLNKGDTIVLTSIAIGSTAAVYINSSVEVYSNMLANSGGNGGNADYRGGGSAGYGGTPDGGNVSNISGSAGTAGGSRYGGNTSINNNPGGSPAHVDGNTGGYGGGAYSASGNQSPRNGSVGKAAFMKIYRGNTNVA